MRGEFMAETKDYMGEAMESAVKDLSIAVNNFDFDRQAKELVLNIITKHRSLQTNIIRMFIGAIKLYAGDNIQYDARNEEAVNACKEITKFIDEKHLSRLGTV